MKRFLAALSVLALLAPLADGGVAHAQRPGQGGMRPLANPSALVAAEMAFARLAQEKGQWTAFAETAAPGAEMFVPHRVVAPDWLKQQANPPVAVQWQPHAVWMSCDGAVGITRGAWQAGGTGSATGWFTTVWQRQKKGNYKWVLDQGGQAAAPIPAPDFLVGSIADCPVRASGDRPPVSPPALPKGAVAPLPPLAGPIPALAAPVGGDARDGRASDGTLAWRSVVLPGGERDFTAWMWKDGTMVEVVRTHAAAPGQKG